jgi:hypothetical protein
VKGMNKIIRGYTFKSVLLYCEGRGDKKHQVDGSGDLPDGRLIGGNMAGRNVQQLMHEFIVARKLRPDIEKTTWHNSLRLPPGDKITDEKWGEIALDYIKRMGFTDSHMYCVWKHDDEEGVHIVACRVGLDGSVFLGQNENLKSTIVIQDLEKAHGLQITKGPDYDPESGKLVMPDVRKLKKAEIEMAFRTGKEPGKQILQRLLDEAVSDSPTLLQLAELLDSAGVVVRANLASTGTFNGFSFEIDGIVFKGSALGKAYSWKGLQAKGVTYEQDRDGPGLQRFRAQTSPDPDSGGAPAAGSVFGGHPGIEQPVSAAEDRRNDPSVGTNDAIAQSVGSEGVQSGPRDVKNGREPGGVEREIAPANARYGGADKPNGQDDAGHSHASKTPGREVVEGGVDPGKGGLRPAEPGQEGRTNAPTGAGIQHGSAADPSDVGQALAADHAAKIDAWWYQHSALQSPFYRLTLVGRAGPAADKRMNLGKRKDGDERFFSPEEVEKTIRQLRWRNASGYDIYITPIDPAHHYLVVDDMTSTTFQALREAGYAPCLVQESSPGNLQAIIKTPRLEGVNEQTVANKLVQQLNLEFGDPKFSGVIHPFRMAGFANKKPGKKSPFTKIFEASHRICATAAQLLDGIRQAAIDLFSQRPGPAPSPRPMAITTDSTDDPEVYQGMPEQDLNLESPTKAFQRAVWSVRGWVKANGLVADDSRIDYRAAVIMLKAGWSADEVEEAMLMGSDRLSERHSNAGDYVTRTVKKASMEIGASAASAKNGPKAK